LSQENTANETKVFCQKQWSVKMFFCEITQIVVQKKYFEKTKTKVTKNIWG
jgi:protein involved in sex pheromone biosynthesis